MAAYSTAPRRRRASGVRPIDPRLQRAQALLSIGRHVDAEPILRGFLSEQPEDPIGLAWLALCRSDAEAHEEARDLAKQAVARAPDLPYAHYVLARVYQSSGWTKEAEAAVRECVAMDPSGVDAWSLLAMIRAQRQDWKGSLEAADHGLAVDPEHAMCTNLRAMALARLGDKEGASAATEGALRRTPEDAFTHANHGWTMLHQGDYRRAEEHFREALRLDPNMEWARDGVLEALKARNPIYRAFLRYKLWMAAMPVGRRLMVIFGGYFLYRIAWSATDANPTIAPVLWALIVAYFVFVLLTWFANPIFNFLLLLHPFGRLALSPREKFGALSVCGLLGVGSAILGYGLLGGGDVWFIAGIWGLFLAAPVNVAAEVEPPVVGRQMTIASAVLALLAGYGLWTMVEHRRELVDLAPHVERLQNHVRVRDDLQRRFKQYEPDEVPEMVFVAPAEELREEVEAYDRESAAMDAEFERVDFGSRMTAAKRRDGRIGTLAIVYPLLCVFGSQFFAAWLATRASRK